MHCLRSPVELRVLEYKLTYTPLGTSISDVSHFLAIFYLPTYLVLLYNVLFLGLSWTPYLYLLTLIWDVNNGPVISERNLRGCKK